MKDLLLSMPQGGGIRGILPVQVLIAIEEQTGKLSRDIFKMIAGTSTGALIAPALALGIPANELLPIYTERAPKEIFSSTFATGSLAVKGYKYPSSNISKVLKSVFGHDYLMNDIRTPLLLTAIGVDRWPWYFTQDNPLNSKFTGTCSVIECATASAAAPWYFSPCYVNPGKDTIGWCFDGGVGVTGNPVFQLCVEAFKYGLFNPYDTKVVSIGTGFYKHPRGGNPPKGPIDTITWTIDTLSSAPRDQQTDFVNLHYPGVLLNFDWQLQAKYDMGDMSVIPAKMKTGEGRESVCGFTGLG
jgi:patatin-like phospholipase/acyl hydrolase